LAQKWRGGEAWDQSHKRKRRPKAKSAGHKLTSRWQIIEWRSMIFSHRLVQHRRLGPAFEASKMRVCGGHFL